MTFVTRETRVGRLRVRAAADDPLAAGMRAEAAVRPLDLVPPGMPPQAILCIRAMADPMPGGIDVRSAYAPRPLEWERTARGAIGDALRRAVLVSPGGETAALAADAPDAVVLFIDRAALLAAAARDAVHDRLLRWYWKDVLRQPTLAAVVAEWKREPMYVPAALELLASAGGGKDDAIAFVRRIPPSDALELTARIFSAIVTATPLPAPEPPWHEVVPEAAAPALAPEQCLLLGVALTIRRAPSLASRRSFAAAAAASLTAPQPATPVIPSVARDWGGRAAPEETFRAKEPHIEDQHPPTRKTEAITQPPSPQITEPAKNPPAETTSTNQPHTHARTQKRHTTESAHLDTQRSTPTDLAGLFFFLNLGLRDEESELGHWQFLALLGRTLEPELVDDALWSVLEGLAEEPLDLDLEPLELPDLETLLRERLPVDHPIEFLLRRFGRVTLTPAHVDVFFSLAAHPIEIRLSGLDRDPGWMLPAGRHVAFHFD